MYKRQVLVYSTCSIEPEETESIIDEIWQAHHQFQRESIAPWLPPAGLPFVTPRGDLSTMANSNRMDLFFAARDVYKRQLLPSTAS